MNQDHKSIKWRLLRDQGELQGRMDDLMNAAFMLPEE